MKTITDYGPCPILEQAAEECTELAQASLKLARKLRGENPTDESWSELWNNLCEEMTHVAISIQAICEKDESDELILYKIIKDRMIQKKESED